MNGDSVIYHSPHTLKSVLSSVSLLTQSSCYPIGVDFNTYNAPFVVVLICIQHPISGISTYNNAPSGLYLCIRLTWVSDPIRAVDLFINHLATRAQEL